MAQQTINVGTAANDGTGDSGRVGAIKINDNFTDLYAVKSQTTYTAITTDTYVMTDAELFLGTNIFGVNYAGAVAITLPDNIDSNKIVIINDESGAAGANNITLTVA